MKALFISDLHGYHSILKRLDITLSKYKDIKAMFCCGDLTSATSDNTLFIKELKEIIYKYKLIFKTICGNSDSQAMRKLFIKNGWHLDEEMIGRRTFVGVDFGYEQYFTGRSVASKILLTHVPPRTKILEQGLINCPIIHFAGHRHFAEGEKNFPSTRLIQIKSAQLGRAAIFNLKNLSLKFIDLEKAS